jgi:ribosomal protein S18 acetylase RimI-like enzyme
VPDSEPTPVPQVVPISAKELERVPEVDVSEEVSGIYLQDGAHISRVDRPHKRNVKSAEQWAPEIQLWQTFVNNGGAAWGAFEAGRLPDGGLPDNGLPDNGLPDSRMIAFVVLRTELSETTAQLAALYVDRSWRRHGLATALVDAVIGASRAGGAADLYVSAARTESAVAFYLGHGFRPVETPNPELFEFEPKDIHMSLPL